MNLLTLVVMVFATSISLLIIRSVAPYEKTSMLKYVSLKSEFLSKLLIQKKPGYVKVADRKKISLLSLVFYCFSDFRNCFILGAVISWNIKST